MLGGRSDRVKDRPRPPTLPPMTRGSAFVLLIVFGAGVFLAGLELMITAVALPSILDDLADASGGSAWIELRKASWIINGYLLVYILTMPLAGRLTDLWGARRPFMAALIVFIVGSVLAGLAQSLDQLIAARVIQAFGGGVLVPVGTAAAAHLYEGANRPRALGRHRRADVPRDGCGPIRRSGAARVGPCRGRPRGCRTRRLVAGPVGARLALGLLRQRPHRVDRPDPRAGPASAGWDTPRRPGRVDVVGAFWFGAALLAALVGLTLIGTTEIAGSAVEPVAVTAGLLAAAALLTMIFVDPRAPRPRPVPRSAAVRDPGLLRRRARLAADRLRVRDGDHRRGGLRRPGPLRRTRRAAARPRRPCRCDRPRGARSRVSPSGCCRCASSRSSGWRSASAGSPAWPRGPPRPRSRRSP